MPPKTSLYIRTSRSYAFITTPEGNIAIIKLWPADETINAQVKGGDVIQPDEIIKWSAPLTFPLDDDDVERLVHSLNLMRVTTHAKEAIPFNLSSAHKRVEKCIAELMRDLPKIIDAQRKFNSRLSLQFSDAYESFLGAVMTVNKHITRTTPPKRSAPWHDDAAYIAAILKRAADRSGRRISFTKPTSPGVKFIRKALHRARVRHGLPASIARALARRKPV